MRPDGLTFGEHFTEILFTGPNSIILLSRHFKDFNEMFMRKVGEGGVTI